MLARLTRRPSPRRRSKISCAVRQHSSRASRSTIARWAAPPRWPATRTRSNVASDHSLIVAASWQTVVCPPMITRLVLILLTALGLAACSGEGDSAPGASDGSSSVIAAFYPLAYAAERIGGSNVDVRNLTPAGAEPHDVELSPRDVEAVRSADVVLYLGGGFQPAVEDAVDGADGRAVDALSGLELLEGGADAGAADPHVWLDPLRFARVADRIGAVLERPEAARGLARELQRLDSD